MLDCPFCASLELSVEEISNAWEVQFQVTCDNCGASGPYAEEKEVAVTLWNRRA